MTDYDHSPPLSSSDDRTTALHLPSGEPCRTLSTAPRKPRGRPPGSKNKPKPPVVITRDSESSMHPVILELAAGSDILDCVASFARRRRVGVSILGASGAVSSVALRQPATASAAFTVSGRFDILSLAGTFRPPGAAAAGFTISVAGARGEVIGGAVAGPVTAGGTVVVVGGCFSTAEILRLPEAAEEDGRREEEGLGVVGPGKGLTGQVSNDMVLWATPDSSRSFSASHLRPTQY